MTAIQASSAGVRDMADGTLRITLEFEPRHAREAFELFGARGTPVAVAALKTGYDAKADTSPEPAQKTPKTAHVGPLAWEAVQLCKNPAFHRWLETEHCIDCANEDIAAEWIKQTCSVESRNQFDSEPHAAYEFITKVRLPFMRREAA